MSLDRPLFNVLFRYIPALPTAAWFLTSTLGRDVLGMPYLPCVQRVRSVYFHSMRDAVNGAAHMVTSVPWSRLKLPAPPILLVNSGFREMSPEIYNKTKLKAITLGNVEYFQPKWGCRPRQPGLPYAANSELTQLREKDAQDLTPSNRTISIFNVGALSGGISDQKGFFESQESGLNAKVRMISSLLHVSCRQTS